MCRGLPSDDGDDLLTGDISALHLSDYDVYAKTGGKPRNSNDYQNMNTRGRLYLHKRFIYIYMYIWWFNSNFKVMMLFMLTLQ